VRFVRRFWHSFGVFVVLATGPALASAQSEAELVRARKLYAQGLTQEAAGDWPGALSSFEDVARIKVTPQVRFHIARSKEHLGRLNEALGGYRLAEYEAEQGGDKDKELVEEVRSARVALEARIPKLLLSRGKGAETIKIELDGVTLGDAQIGKEITVDPGPHVVVGVLSPGKTFKKQVTLSEGQSLEVVLDVPGDLGASPTAPVEPAPREHHETPAPAPATKDGAPHRPSYGGPLILGGVGVASIVASVIFYGKAKDAQSELDAGCIGRKCPESLRDTQSRGETYTALGGVTLGVGLASLAAGGLLALGAASSSEPRPAASLSLEPRRWQLSFTGAF
jgi:hypothetical protein